MTDQRLPKLERRARDSHKGTFGRALLIGGSRGMAGAISIAGMAALRSGAGLVRVAVPDPILETVASMQPCLVTTPFASDPAGRFDRRAADGLLELSRQATCVALGPGLGRSDDLDILVDKLYQSVQVPMVVDADALNAVAQQTKIIAPLALVDPVKSNLNSQLAQHSDIVAPLAPSSGRGAGGEGEAGTKVESIPTLPISAGPRILTPHPGEFERLTGIPGSDRNRQTLMAKLMASKHGIVIVLKGFETVVTDGDSIILNRTGNPKMAVGGSGDCLTGIITALVCQGMKPFDAAHLGVALHGLAGDIAAQRLSCPSVLATDLINDLPAAFHQLDG